MSGVTAYKNPTDNTELTGQYNLDGGGSNNSGGSGVSSAQAEADRRAQLTMDQLYEITQKNQAALQNKLAQSQNMYDISDQQARNLADAQTFQNKRNAADDWFTQIKKAQGATEQLKGTAGDSMNGSNMYQMMNLLQRMDNDIDNEALTTMRKNQDTINNDLFETLAANNNARNEAALDTEYGLRQVANDYLAQRSSLSPDTAQEGSAWEDWSHVGDGVYDSNKREAISPDRQGLYREDNADARAKQLAGNVNANASAANVDYWNNLLGGYKKRS